MLTPAELIARHDKPGPRYTSYPTVPAWSASPPDTMMDDALEGLSEPASVYVHVPFCREQCLYCGCNMAVAGRQSAGDRYLDALEQVVAGLALPSEADWPVERLHLGGGTPTWLSPVQLRRLVGLVEGRFARTSDAVLSVEADPAVTTQDHLDTLAELGFGRLSIGVQSFDPVVLEAVRRPQQPEHIGALVEGARERGIDRVNLDLMYGLPHQSSARFGQTLARTLELRPDRLAVFGYAHVPWMKAHQKKLDTDALPTPAERLDLWLQAHETLTSAGYVAIGMDHFALADDPLAVAQEAGTLGRDFMGYTTRARHTMIGLGMSAISELPRHYLQQRAHLGRWYKAVDGKEPMLEKGMALSDEDVLRRDVIMGIMCNLRLVPSEIEAAHGIDFHEHFAAEWAALEPLEADGLVKVSDDLLEVTGMGRLLVRNVARLFDTYLRRPSTTARFSQAV